MFKIETTYGILYVRLEDDNRIDIYDSNKKYLDCSYSFTEANESDAEILETFCKQLQSYNSIDKMLEGEAIDSYTMSEDWQDLIEDIFLDDYEVREDNNYYCISDDSLIGYNRVANNDFVNKIGNKYILLTES